MARSLSKHDSSLDPRVDKLCRRDVIDHINGDKHCAGIRAHMRLAREHPIAVAAERHEIIGRKLVVAADVERFAVDRHRFDARPWRRRRIGNNEKPRNLREPSRLALDPRKPVLKSVQNGFARNFGHHPLVAERKFVEDIALHESGSRRIVPIPSDTAPVDDRNLGCRRLAERIGKEVADRAFRRAHGLGAAVSGAARVAISTSNSRFNPALYIWTFASMAGSGLVFAVSTTRKFGHPDRERFMSLWLGATSMSTIVT